METGCTGRPAGHGCFCPNYASQRRPGGARQLPVGERVDFEILTSERPIVVLRPAGLAGP
ncbi:hypothetical protein I79_008453 [Cricetulus griseus]|uniref:Uncharacterized protein n=1 Tax=Cricetulus griseus TaxID=10029 RepID=G3HD77_CRIGR|nr:hypothetical protein I79_008453 [Cricetulus griseus]